MKKQILHHKNGKISVLRDFKGFCSGAAPDFHINIARTRQEIIRIPYSTSEATASFKLQHAELFSKLAHRTVTLSPTMKSQYFVLVLALTLIAASFAAPSDVSESISLILNNFKVLNARFSVSGWPGPQRKIHVLHKRWYVYGIVLECLVLLRET